MISKDLHRAAALLASTHQNCPETLPNVLPLFAEIVAMTQRELLTYLLKSEPDWPWQKPPQQKQSIPLINSSE